MYNLLVVDDEALIRKSIISKLKKYPGVNFNIKEASNAEDARKIAQENDINLIITDIRMGGETGLDLIISLKPINKHIKYIIISGYSEFSYASEAISLGVVEYLLKPINTEKLINAVKKALEKLESDSFNNKSKELLEVNSDAFKLAALLKNKKIITSEELNPFLKNVSSNCYYQEIRLFVDKPSEMIINLLYEAICASNYKYGNNITIYVDKFRQVGLIFKFREKLVGINKEQLSLIEHVSEALESLGMYTFNFAVSDLNRDLIKSHKKARYTLNHRVLLSDYEVITYEKSKTFIDNYTLSKDKKLHFNYLLNSQSYNDISSFINEVAKDIGKIQVSYTSLEQLFLFFRDAIISKYNLNLSNDEKSLNIYLFNSTRELFDYIKLLVLDSISTSEISNNKSRTIVLVNNLKTFIEDNFDENIGLDIFADRNNVNTSFLSNQFHKIVGVTFQEYLNDVRINKAKELLIDNNYKIGVVAKLCGFSTSHYFSKAFKKSTSLTPSEYKEKYQK